MQAKKLIFLPGAGGSPEFWHAMSNQLSHPAKRRLLGWPGFGNIPPDPDVNGIDDLVRMVLDEIDQPCALIAQSMGGAIALRATLARPELVSHLVLTATSGGIDLSGLGATDWRPAFFAANPTLPRWFDTYQENLASQVSTLTVPALLLWGDNDPISPVAVGERLHTLLRNSRLHIVAGGEHDFARTSASALAAVVDRHLAGRDQER